MTDDRSADESDDTTIPDVQPPSPVARQWELVRAVLAAVDEAVPAAADTRGGDPTSLEKTLKNSMVALKYILDPPPRSKRRRFARDAQGYVVPMLHRLGELWRRLQSGAWSATLQLGCAHHTRRGR